MAILDEEPRAAPRDRLNDRIRERTDGSGMIAMVVLALVVGILAWWLFANRSADNTGVTRTSPPVTTTAPNNTAPNTTAPTTTPKQP